QVSEQRHPLDLEISGPGSLFWTRRGTRTRQGTEITLWLRKELHGKPVRLEHNRDRCWERLRIALKVDTKLRKGDGTGDGLDPGFIAAQHVLWPKYPIRVSPPAAEQWTIDDRFRDDALAPISRDTLTRKGPEW